MVDPSLQAAGRGPGGGFNAALGVRIATLRWRAGFSEDVFARMLGVRRAELVRYERGHAQVPASMLWRISQETGVAIEALFHFDQGGVCVFQPPDPFPDEGAGRAYLPSCKNTAH